MICRPCKSSDAVVSYAILDGKACGNACRVCGNFWYFPKSLWYKKWVTDEDLFKRQLPEQENG